MRPSAARSARTHRPDPRSPIPDPRPLAARLPRLDVLLDASGEHDVELGRDLARIGRGTLHVVRDYRGVAPAVSSIFGG